MWNGRIIVINDRLREKDDSLRETLKARGYGTAFARDLALSIARTPSALRNPSFFFFSSPSLALTRSRYFKLSPILTHRRGSEGKYILRLADGIRADSRSFETKKLETFVRLPLCDTSWVWCAAGCWTRWSPGDERRFRSHRSFACNQNSDVSSI